jgi:hypothetical protein
MSPVLPMLCVSRHRLRRRPRLPSHPTFPPLSIAVTSRPLPSAATVPMFPSLPLLPYALPSSLPSLYARVRWKKLLPQSEATYCAADDKVCSTYPGPCGCEKNRSTIRGTLYRKRGQGHTEIPLGERASTRSAGASPLHLMICFTVRSGCVKGTEPKGKGPRHTAQATRWAALPWYLRVTSVLAPPALPAARPHLAAWCWRWSWYSGMLPGMA